MKKTTTKKKAPAKAGKITTKRAAAPAKVTAKKAVAEVDELDAELQKQGHEVQALGGDRYGIIAPLQAVAAAKGKGTARAAKLAQQLADSYDMSDERPAMLGSALHHTRNLSMSKQAQAIALLKEPGGVLLTVLAEMFGWKKWTVRGFISGAIKKKLGYKVTSEKAGSNRLYRIVGGPRPAAE